MFAHSNWKQSRVCSWCADVCSAERVCFQETPERGDKIAAYHGTTQAMSSTRSALPRQNSTECNVLFLLVGQQGHHVQPNGGCDVHDWKRLAGRLRYSCLK